MTRQFNTIGIIGKHGDPTAGGTLLEVINYFKQHDYEVLLDENAFDVSPELIRDMVGVERHELGERCDLAIVVGGDGTLLNAARSLVDYEVPIIGINLGRLGFLADISPNELSQHLDQILAGNYVEEKRALLHAQVFRNGEEINESSAFNDVVVHKTDVARMIEYETYIGGKYVNNTRADGLIVSTPTGSTAYALSGGGPIVHPSLNALILVPICPHTMSYRPIVVDGDTTVEIILTEDNQGHAQVTCDGQIDLGLMNGDRVVIKRKEKFIRLIHPSNYNYYEILRAKLHWGKRLEP